METRGTCCCCLLRPPHRDMKTPYSHLDTENTEIYSDMLVDSFGIHVILGNHDCGICKVCVRRLRDASDFKLQVQRSQAELQAQLDSEVHFKDEEPVIKLETSEDEEPVIKFEISEDDNLKDMLMLNEEAIASAHSPRESPVASLYEENLGQSYAVKLMEFSDDETLHQTPQETFSNRSGLATQADQTHNSQKNLPKNTFGVRKEKKRRNTRQLQSEKENDVIYSLRSKITFKSERPPSDFRDKYSTGPYTCEICQKAIATKRSMACHMQNHLEPKSEICEDNTWDCDICEKIFSTKKGVKLHMANIHSKKTIKCDICSKRYSTISLLNLHKRIHTERERNHCCEICGKQFLNNCNLSAHKKVHAGVKPFTCDICKKQFRIKSELEGHINVHIGLKPYSCECGKKFARLSSYKKHQLIKHKKDRRERTFLCEICNKRFQYSHHLKRHKLLHTGEKPHACETCGKQFAAKFNLNTHLLTHIKDKTYYCELCSKTYSTKEGLRQHNRIHTGKENMKRKRKNKKE